MQIQGITETKGRNYKTYTFEKAGFFYEAGYKGLRACQNVNFLSCNYMVFNGKVQLMYHLYDYCPLELAASTLSPNALTNVMVHIFDSCLEMKGISFIHMETVSFSPNDIYVNLDTLEPFFIYLPIHVKSSAEYFYTISDYIKKTFSILMRQKDNSKNGLGLQVIHELENPRNTIENLKNNIAGLIGMYKEHDVSTHKEILYADQAPECLENDSEVEQIEKQDKIKNEKSRQENTYAETSVLAEEFRPSIALISRDKTKKIMVDRRELILGQKEEFCDACIKDDSNISRRHCKIEHINGRNYVTDLNSTNGTFVNGNQISPSQRVEIAPGDNLRLADLEFIITNIAGIGG